MTLPEASDRPAPKLPTWRQWQSPTKKWWTVLWSKPQAVMWEPDGSTLVVLALLYDDVIAGRADAAKVSAEMRQHEDRHGLSPRAMVQLRWRFAGDMGESGDVGAPSDAGAAVVSLAGRRRGA